MQIQVGREFCESANYGVGNCWCYCSGNFECVLLLGLKFIIGSIDFI